MDRAPILTAGEPGIIQTADRIRRGGVVVYPTETVYGLGADPFNPSAFERIFELKGREAEKGLILLVRDRKDVDALVAHVPRAAEVLIDAFWPGPEGVDQDFRCPWNVSNKRVHVLPVPDEQDQPLLRFPALELEDTLESGRVERVCAEAVDGLRRIDDNAAPPDPIGCLNDARLTGRQDGRPIHCQNRLSGRKRVDVCSKAETKAMKSPNPTAPLPSRSKRASADP